MLKIFSGIKCAIIVLFLMGCGTNSANKTFTKENPMEEITVSQEESFSNDENLIANHEENHTTSGETTAMNQNSKTITFIQLNDLHANIVGHNEQVKQEGNSTIKLEKMGGLAKIKTQIDSIRQENNHTILMNIGDTYHGTAESMFTNGNMVVDLVNNLGVDVGVMGNWDFAYGPIVTHLRYGKISQDDVQRPNFKVIAANATCALPSQIASMGAFAQTMATTALENTFGCKVGELFLDPTHIIEKEGIKIGFIGLTSDIVDRMHEMMGFNLDFTQGKENYVTLINDYATELKNAGADMVVVMSELGIHKDYALAKVLSKENVQVIFSAHTHELTQEPLVSDSGIYVVEAGNDAYLGEMKVTFNASKAISDLNWKLYKMDALVAEDAEMKAAIATARAGMLVDNPNIAIPSVQLEGMPDVIKNMMPSPFSQTLNHSLDKTLAHTDLLLDRRDALESNLNNAITDLLRSEYSKEVSMTPGFRFDSTVVEHEHDFGGHHYHYSHENEAVISGDIKTADIYRFFPAPYYIAEGNITGENLRAIVEENLHAVYATDTFEHSGGWFDGFSGLNMEVNLTQAKNQRLLSLKKLGSDTEIANNEVLSVVGCAKPFDMNAETTLCSYNRFTGVQNILKEGNTYAISDFFIDQILNGELAKIANRKNITDVSNTTSGFYQPLEGAE